MRRNRTTRSHAPARHAVVAAAILFCRVAGADQPVVTVRTVTDDNITGRLVEFSLQRGLVMFPDDGDGPCHFPAEDVVHVVTDLDVLPRTPGSVRLELVGGDLLFGRVVGSEADLLDFDSPSLGQIRVPLDRIVAWKTPAADDPRLRSAVEALTDRERDAVDALLLTNGDILRGFVATIDRDGFVFETDAGRSRVGHAAVAAVVMVPMDPARSRPAEPKRPVATLLTTNGQRLTVSALDWSDASASVTVFGRIAYRIPADRIARIDVVGGRWQWLTDLEPISYEHTPALSLDWGWKTDRNVAGGPLRVSGRTYQHGLGVHSECSITFDLVGAFSQFVTSMGLDDQAGPYADVDVEIRVDGQLRFARRGIRPGTLHGPVRLDVTEAKRIKLTVLFGRNADLQDRFDWIETALIR